MSDDFLKFNVKVGKSFKNKGYSVSRGVFTNLIPKSDYEKECDLIVDNIPVKGKLNIVPRLFFKNDEFLINHLKKLHDIDPKQKIDVELILNKETESTTDVNSKITELENEIKYLTNELEKYKKLYDNLKSNTLTIADDMLALL